jgi:hypothetical protein
MALQCSGDLRLDRAGVDVDDSSLLGLTGSVAVGERTVAEGGHGPLDGDTCGARGAGGGARV